MASSNPTSTESDAGFATPAAAAVSLGLAMVATAAMTAGIMELKLTRNDLAVAKAEYALAGAQARATLSLIQSKPAPRYAWSVAIADDAAQALAESEYSKLNLQTAANLDDATLARLGVQDSTSLRSRLSSMAASNDLEAEDIANADASLTWRACAPSLISPFGAATKRTAEPTASPTSGQLDWRIGEVWRVQTRLSSGWTDDRIVRFTGDARLPAAVIERRFYKTSQGGGQCDAIVAAN